MVRFWLCAKMVHGNLHRKQGVLRLTCQFGSVVPDTLGGAQMRKWGGSEVPLLPWRGNPKMSIGVSCREIRENVWWYTYYWWWFQPVFLIFTSQKRVSIYIYIYWADIYIYNIYLLLGGSNLVLNSSTPKKHWGRIQDSQFFVDVNNHHLEEQPWWVKIEVHEKRAGPWWFAVI